VRFSDKVFHNNIVISCNYFPNFTKLKN